MRHSIRDEFGKFAKRPIVVYETNGLSVTGDELWNKYIPLSHEQAIEVLTRDLPPETEIKITLAANRKGSIGMRAEGIFNESYHKYSSRRFNLKEGTLGAGYFEVNSAHQGSGVGRHVLRNEMEFFYQCNVKRFNIHPALSAGGYTWARVGFLPSDLTTDGFTKDTKELVEERYAAIRSYLDEEAVEVLDAAVKLEDPQDIWRISDSGPINDGLMSIFNAMSGKDDGLLSNQEASIKKSFAKEQSWGAEALAHIQSSIHEGKRVTAGRILLSGTDWHSGHVDMTDAKQMARVGAYVGGWHHISPG